MECVISLNSARSSGDAHLRLVSRPLLEKRNAKRLSGEECVDGSQKRKRKKHAKVTRIRPGSDAASPLMTWEERYKSFFTDFTTFNGRELCPATRRRIDFWIKILFYSVNVD